MTQEEAIKWLRRQLYARRLVENGICHTMTTFSAKTADKYREAVSTLGGQVWEEHTEIRRWYWTVGGRPPKYIRTRYQLTAHLPIKYQTEI